MDGTRQVSGSLSGSLSGSPSWSFGEPEKLGEALAGELIGQGARSILDEIRADAAV
ncbi:hypothetical protein GCM10022420_047640 [Streptomyces iranensis]|uniref:Uncharacterized protein n=1 Tax=Streptomyces iranensis TaxID=576784 RepID=A0A060ZPY4_9ACTN|nr:predicted protein [Streptomyces iranensis]